MTGGALLAAIVSNPAEDTVRLAYADWLEENNQEGRARFIRLCLERRPRLHLFTCKCGCNRANFGYGWDEPAPSWLATDPAGWLWRDCGRYWGKRTCAVFTRGFVSEIMVDRRAIEQDTWRVVAGRNPVELITVEDVAKFRLGPGWVEMGGPDGAWERRTGGREELLETIPSWIRVLGVS